MNQTTPEAGLPDRVRVRKGLPEDGDRLCELVSALADYERLPRPTADARARLVRDAFGPRPLIDVWLGEFDGAPVGYAISFYTYSTFLALPTFYLEDLFVLPAYRALKVGKALFLYCVRMAFEMGCGRLEWQVLRWNEPALAFYHHLGGRPMDDWLPFRATRDELAQILGEPGS